MTLPDTSYTKVRALAVFSKLLGAFPIQNVLERDGRKLKHKWTNAIFLWDALVCSGIMYVFIRSCEILVTSAYGTNLSILTVWLVVTCYVSALRGFVQFILVHIYSSRLPKLFAEIEEFHQVIATSIIKPSFYRTVANVVCLLWAVGSLFMLEIASYVFFSQLNGQHIFLAIWPVTFSFLFVNLWRELPMQMLVLVCMYVTGRLGDISEELRILREKRSQDCGAELKNLRQMHASLIRIVAHLQKCYGMQLAINYGFLIVDVVLQLFMYFAIAGNKNVFLLCLALYYWLTSVFLYAIIDRMERKGEGILEELSAFDVSSENREQQIQVQLFMTQLAARPVQISASGFYTVNNRLVPSVMASVATYLIVLIQFAPYIDWIGNMKSNSTKYSIY